MAGWDRDLAAEEQAGMTCGAPADDRSAGTVERILVIRKKRSEVWAVAGRLDDDVELLVRSVGEMHICSRYPRDTGTDSDYSAADTIDCPDIQEWDFPVLGGLRHWSLCRP
ncbi:MAG TPA: hypothetical protein VK281_14565, partial [Xanthobacteraceae bacterium]|nr:hypothetical protein [Xanthobacteraceae bacterium]